MSPRARRVAMRSLVIPIAVVGAGCGHSTRALDAKGVKVADRYARAVFVNHDCKVAAASSHPPGGPLGDCSYLRKSWRDNFRIVRRSGQLARGCTFQAVLLLPPAPATSRAGDCVVYHLIGLVKQTAAGETLQSLGYGYERLFLDKIKGQWKVVAASYNGGSRFCAAHATSKDCPQLKLWRQRLPLDSKQPSLRDN